MPVFVFMGFQEPKIFQDHKWSQGISKQITTKKINKNKIKRERELFTAETLSSFFKRQSAVLKINNEYTVLEGKL